MKIGDIEDNAKNFIKSWDREEFIYQFLGIYGLPKATITRLKDGGYNQAKIPSDVLLKDKIYFHTAGCCDLFEELLKIEAEKSIATYSPRFVMVTDFDGLVARDTKTKELLDIKFSDFVANCYFFQPLAGFEKVHFENEKEADIKASDKMAKLFDEIASDNPGFDRHALNVFFTRLLFCLFAEDTQIFPENAFTDFIHTHTEKDGSDVHSHIKTIFDVLDQRDRTGLSETLSQFPYVNGGLFRDHYDIPKFGAKSRRMLIDAGVLDWAEIHPDIFGSMFQAVIDPDKRHDLGMHYTSVTNIMKVIRPLFLDAFYEELEKARGNKKKLEKLQRRLAEVKLFDPACGSGNFLIIAYKELRILEMEVLEELKAFGHFPLSQITVDQFYGIEYDDFAHEVAILALWLAEHQMNLLFKGKFGSVRPSLPLKEGAKIVCGNACRIAWETVCPKNAGDEIYILGNPPYLGARMQNEMQKKDVLHVLGKRKENKDLDYISCWFYLGAKYIAGTHAAYAFVSTNSICQGEQVALLWPYIFEQNLEINFAVQSFKWTNNAKNKAGVTCCIVGLKNKSTALKSLFISDTCRKVSSINCYLIPGDNVIIEKRKIPLSLIPKMSFGSQPRDGGFLIFSSDEKDKVCSVDSKLISLFKMYSGGVEFIRGQKRWCLWITDKMLPLAKSNEVILDRINKVFEFRTNSSAKTTRGYASIPHKLAQRAHKDSTSIIIPATTSENRVYIPMGFLDESTVISNSAQAIYDAQPWIFGVLTSKIHMAWMRITCGRLKTDYRYSSALCYNTFPIPDLSEKQKAEITEKAMQVLAIRERYPEKTMADLYDPKKMPNDLRAAHHELDLTVDAVYRAKPFANDEERLEVLFALYEKMLAEESSKSPKKKGKK